MFKFFFCHKITKKTAIKNGHYSKKRNYIQKKLLNNSFFCKFAPLSIYHIMYLTRFLVLFGTILLSLPGVCQEPHKLTGEIIGTGASVDYSTNQMSTTVNTKAMAFDGNLSTFFASYARSNTWVGLDLKTPHVITRVGWSPRNDSHGPARVLLAVFEGANKPDFSDAIPLYMTKKQGVIGQMAYEDLSMPHAFRYVRYVGPNDARCNVAELEFYGYESEATVYDPSEGEAVKVTPDSYYRPTNLPLVVIHTQNAQEPYDKVHDIDAFISIISDDKILADTATIRLRGNASMGFPKKPYRIKWDEKHKVLGSPAKAKKWTLINNYGDKTLMRNMIAFEISRRIGLDYTPFCTPVDVMLNGEYKGCYQLCDQIEVNKNRVAIDEMDEKCVSGEALTGGYFVEVDAYCSDEPVYFWSSKGNPVTIKSPDSDIILAMQKDYINRRFNELESRLFGNYFTDDEKGYRSMLDLASFLRHFIVGELSGNTDTYWSTYLYKPRGDEHFYAGPVWDFDLAFDNDSRTYPVNSRTDWIYRSGGSYAGNMKSFVDRIVVSDSKAKAELLEIWEDIRKNCDISAESLNEYVDETAELLQESQYLNFLRWPILSQRVHQNPQASGSYAGEIKIVKNYITKRVPWFDKKVGFDATGIDTPIYNNEYTETDDAIYTLSGQRVEELLAPGIYIKNGRKIIISVR